MEWRREESRGEEPIGGEERRRSGEDEVRTEGRRGRDKERWRRMEEEVRGRREVGRRGAGGGEEKG